MNTDSMGRRIREEVARQKAQMQEGGPSNEPVRDQTLGRLENALSPQPAQDAAPDVDAMMREVRETVARRKGTADLNHPGATDRHVSPMTQTQPLNTAAFESVTLPRLSGPGGRFVPKDTYALADFLQFHDDDFVRYAYRAILRREPDASGHATFLAALREGRLAKTDILGRMRFSAEGRTTGVRVRGLALPFALRTLRRAPVLGRVVGIVQYLVRLPDIVRSHERLEATLFHRESELRRQIDLAEAEIERVLMQSRQRAETRFATFERALERKADDERITTLSNHFVSLIRVRPEQKDIEALATRTDGEVRVIRAMLDVLVANKADAERVDAVQRAAETNVHLMRGQLDALEVVLHELREAIDQLGAEKVDRPQLDVIGRQVDDRFAALQDTIKADRARFDLIVSDMREMRTAKADVGGVENAVGLVRRDLAEQHRVLLDQQRRVAALLDETRRRTLRTAGVADVGSAGPEYDHALDAVYASFESRFRGEPQEIKRRLAVYIPTIREANAGIPSAPVIDVGCGRGDWLELLQELGFTATGIDLNRVNANDCRNRGLDVIESDAVEYLRSLSDGSVGAVTGMHIIEHLPFRSQLALIDESYRVLRAGGALILETPNPENLLVGSCNFWLDPTHQQPIPPATMSYFIEARGFSAVRVERMHPYAEGERLTEGAPGVIQRINLAFYSAQDYAVIAIKAEA